MMKPVKISFVIGDLSEENIKLLKENYSVVSKMILTPDDYTLFQYQVGDLMQVETHHGNRLWCRITQLEKVQDTERVIIILTLSQAQVSAPDLDPPSSVPPHE